jgi:hypothetical protein
MTPSCCRHGSNHVKKALTLLSDVFPSTNTFSLYFMNLDVSVPFCHVPAFFSTALNDVQGRRSVCRIVGSDI